MSSSDAFRHTYRINRIIVETAEIALDDLEVAFG